MRLNKSNNNFFFFKKLENKKRKITNMCDINSQSAINSTGKFFQQLKKEKEKVT